MPVYEFRCAECGGKEEVVVPMDDRNDTRLHSCGAVMERLISLPNPAIITVYGRDSLLDTLNAEEKRPVVNGTPVRSKRSKQALTRGLDYVVPLEERVFPGFG